MPYIILGAVVLLLLIPVFLYNSLISRKNRVDFAYSGIDVQLKKRHDLIPNLVSTVKEYMEYEKDLLSEITRLRSEVMKPDLGDRERFDMENQLGGALGRLKIAVENYPDLKANTNFLQLQGTLNEVESQIAASRRAYNAAVFEFNNGVEMFPSNIIANMMGLTRKESFVAPEAEKANVDVGDLFDRS
jgi:LemA protein